MLFSQGIHLMTFALCAIIILIGATVTEPHHARSPTNLQTIDKRGLKKLLGLKKESIFDQIRKHSKL
jgi:hypothetical protein